MHARINTVYWSLGITYSWSWGSSCAGLGFSLPLCSARRSNRWQCFLLPFLANLQGNIFVPAQHKHIRFNSSRACRLVEFCGNAELEQTCANYYLHRSLDQSWETARERTPTVFGVLGRAGTAEFSTGGQKIRECHDFELWAAYLISSAHGNTCRLLWVTSYIATPSH